MLHRSARKTKKAQTFIEYTVVIGAVVMIMFAMSTMLKRGIQGMVKTVADEFGNQINAEQRFDPEGGYLEESYVSTRATTDKTRRELLGVTNFIYADVVITDSNALSNLGFTPEPN